MLSLTPSVQSPAAYDRTVLAEPDASARASLRSRLADQGFRYKITPEEEAESLTDEDLAFGFDPGDALRYGAKPDESGDSTDAINAALACNKRVIVPPGMYRVDGSIEVKDGRQLILSKGAWLVRRDAHSSSTDPVVYVLGERSELRGGLIYTEKACPNGLVCLGHASTSDNSDATRWRFTDCDLSMQSNDGDIGIYVPSGQVTYPERANYFGTIQNINIFGGDIQIYLPELSNAHNISNVQFWNGKRVGVRLRGAYGNNIRGLFFHWSSQDGYIGVELQNQLDPGGQHHSSFNKISHFTVETSRDNDRSLVIESSCELNHIDLGSNVVAGYTIDNPNNWVVVNGSLVAARSLRTSGPLFVAGKAELSGDLEVAGTAQVGESRQKHVVTSAFMAGAANYITPAGFLRVGRSALLLVSIHDASDNNLMRTDLLLVNIRDNSHSGSTLTVVDSAYQTTGATGEPESVTYALNFAGGDTVPRLTANVTRTGGSANMSASVKVVDA